MSEKRWGQNLRKILKVLSFTEYIGLDDPFERESTEIVSDPYHSHSWVNICISILMRNVGRAPFLITLDGEAFWFFGDDNSAGIPREIYVLNPRKIRAYLQLGIVVHWFYFTDQGMIPIPLIKVGKTTPPKPPNASLH
ncbi:hypothetical protein [Oceanispirochaeta sp.]|jgi:hypothetical protein|uniref:hypothetical protein n=1 Tax=Oceanispirochaeta sp. TaxID=2035350 RepID=UPI002629F5E4|nr:hypothetical protein [Oceanispirochaeta sp.]MDA3957457.1 hypothetical protein [Oceanispirochaeta sp.]